MIIPSLGFCIGLSVETVVSQVSLVLTSFHTLLRNHIHCKLLKVKHSFGHYTIHIAVSNLCLCIIYKFNPTRSL